MAPAVRSEIRDSKIRSLLDKVKRQSHHRFLARLRLDRIRLFSGASLSFEFPVTALIGPNGGGKTTVLGVAGCVYSAAIQQKVFLKSSVGDEDLADWRIEYELIDRETNPRGVVSGTLLFNGKEWTNSGTFARPVVFLSLMRTLPLSENPNFQLRSRLVGGRKKKKFRDNKITTVELSDEVSARIRGEGERVLGKDLSAYKFFAATSVITFEKAKRIKGYRPERVQLADGRWAIVDGPKVETKSLVEHRLTQNFAVGKNEVAYFSELNFGAGESSVLRIIADIEAVADGGLILIDEIENGLHPVAVRRLVEYLIDVAERKSLQVIFTTHSDHALTPLPGEGIWACLDGRVQQGKLSVEALRAVSGRIDKRLAVFVEDEFVSHWITTMLRERLGVSAEEVGVYAVGGDGSAVKTHLAHLINPSIGFHSLCFIDGDSKQREDNEHGIFRMPGSMPETKVFDDVLANLDKNVALLTLACQRPLDKQEQVRAAVEGVSRTNRDPHLLFAQVGAALGFVPEATVRGAFLAIWIQEQAEDVDKLTAAVTAALEGQRLG